MNDTPENDAASRQDKRRNRPPKRRCTCALYGTCTTCPEIAERRRAAERRNTTRPPRNPAGGFYGPHGLPLPFFGRPSMSAATTATVHDIDVLLRVIAVRQLLDAYATGMLLSTSGSLDNLANVLQSAAQHQKAADLERGVAA